MTNEELIRFCQGIATLADFRTKMEVFDYIEMGQCKDAITIAMDELCDALVTEIRSDKP